jgi:hypothetical protein
MEAERRGVCSDCACPLSQRSLRYTLLHEMADADASGSERGREVRDCTLSQSPKEIVSRGIFDSSW